MNRTKTGILLLFILPLLFGCDDSNKPATELTLATWNIYWLTEHASNIRGEQDYERLRKYADALKADVIALQEVENEDFARLVFGDGYLYYFSNRPGGRGTQRVGVAVRKSAAITVHQALPYEALDVGAVRYGMDVIVEKNRRRLRILAVHLKSGCFDQPLDETALTALTNTVLLNACEKLNRQIPPLERWIDERAAGSLPYVILGDFNRRLHLEQRLQYEEDEGLWPALNDPEVALSQTLFLAGANAQPACWGGRFEAFIDHILMDARAHDRLQPHSFTEWIYTQTDYDAYHALLSDHCPLSVSFFL